MVLKSLLNQKIHISHLLTVTMVSSARIRLGGPVHWRDRGRGGNI